MRPRERRPPPAHPSCAAASAELEQSAHRDEHEQPSRRRAAPAADGRLRPRRSVDANERDAGGRRAPPARVADRRRRARRRRRRWRVRRDRRGGTTWQAEDDPERRAARARARRSRAPRARTPRDRPRTAGAPWSARFVGRALRRHGTLAWSPQWPQPYQQPHRATAGIGHRLPRFGVASRPHRGQIERRNGASQAAAASRACPRRRPRRPARWHGGRGRPRPPRTSSKVTASDRVAEREPGPEEPRGRFVLRRPRPRRGARGRAHIRQSDATRA